MNTSLLINQPAKNQVHWPSVWQFVLSAFAIMSFWSGAVLFASVGMIELFNNSGSGPDALSMFMVSVAMAVCGLLMLPGATYAALRLINKPVWRKPRILRKLHFELWILAFPAVIGLGYLLAGVPHLAWLFLPWLHILAVGLPILWLLTLVLRNLPLGSPQRMWGLLSNGLAFAPSLIMIAEGAAVIFFLMLAALALASQPEIVKELNELSVWMTQAEPTPEALLDTFAPYLANTNIFFFAITLAAVVVPLIEELIKPLGLWFFADRGLSPAAGFAAGVLCGAGYAFIESLLLASSGQEWVTLVLARIGTGLVHILASGIVGWGLAYAWRSGKYLWLGVSYLGAVLIHGLWNTLTLLTTFAALADMPHLNLEVPAIFSLGDVATYGLAFLAAGAFAALLWLSHALARNESRTASIATDIAEPGTTASSSQTENML